jgi:hypothetical protein
MRDIGGNVGASLSLLLSCDALKTEVGRSARLPEGEPGCVEPGLLPGSTRSFMSLSRSRFWSAREGVGWNNCKLLAFVLLKLPGDLHLATPPLTPCLPLSLFSIHAVASALRVWPSSRGSHPSAVASLIPWWKLLFYTVLWYVETLGVVFLQEKSEMNQRGP